MKTERELFEAWCVKDDEFCIHRYDGSDDYSDDYTQSAWLAWIASAKRDGYKLVPVCSHEWSIQLSGRFICDLCGEFMDTKP